MTPALTLHACTHATELVPTSMAAGLAPQFLSDFADEVAPSARTRALHQCVSTASAVRACARCSNVLACPSCVRKKVR